MSSGESPVEAAKVLRYGVLGPLSVVRGDGVPIELGPPKQRMVLGLLLPERGGVVGTDRTIDALWGSSPPPSALASLQAYVSNLRRALRDEERATSPITRRAPGYSLDIEAEQIDLADFIRGARATRRAIDAGGTRLDGLRDRDGESAITIAQAARTDDGQRQEAAVIRRRRTFVAMTRWSMN